MKKTILIITIILTCAIVYSQDTTKVKTVPKDTITIQDVQKHIYLTSVDWGQFLTSFYNDSIPVAEFYGKSIDGEFWRTKGRYYLDPWDPIPPGVKYLKRKPTWAAYAEFMMIKYKQK